MFQGVRKILLTKQRNTGVIGGAPMTCGQQSVGASSEDNTRQNIENGNKHRNTQSKHAVE